VPHCVVSWIPDRRAAGLALHTGLRSWGTERRPLSAERVDSGYPQGDILMAERADLHWARCVW